MKPGPRPTPTATLRLRGSWRAKGRTGEPQPPKGYPPCPEWLSADAAEKYHETAKTLQSMNILTIAETDVLARYADTWAWHRRCRAFLEKHGDSYPVFDEAGNQTAFRHYPEVALANRLAGQLAAMERELGLTPSARTALKAPPAENPAKPKFNIA